MSVSQFLNDQLKKSVVTRGSSLLSKPQNLSYIPYVTSLGTFDSSLVSLSFQFLLVYNCFTVLRQFVVYSKVNQLCVCILYIYPLFQISFPFKSPQSIEQTSVFDSLFLTSYLFYTLVVQLLTCVQLFATPWTGGFPVLHYLPEFAQTHVH